MLRRFLVPLALVAMAGCSSVKIYRQAMPNPLTAQTPFVLEAPTFTNLFIGKKPEAEYFARRGAAERARFEADKAMFVNTYGNGALGARGALMFGPPDSAGKFVIHSSVENLQQGAYTHFVNIATRARTRVTITDPNGAVLDELTIDCKVKSSLFHADETQRVADCAQSTARDLMRYLRRRAR